MRRLSLLIMASAVAFIGCNGNMLTYKGATITKLDHVIQLQQGDQQGRWKTNEIAVNYRYQMVPGSLKISGNVSLLGGFAVGFNSIDRLVVQLLFLDSQGTVIDNAIIYSADNHHPTDLIPMNFEKVIFVAPGTTAFSFTYDGKLSDGGGDIPFRMRNPGNTEVNIWYFPS